MARHEEQTGRKKEVVIQPEITRAFWSKRRAWQGNDVKLFIETKHVKDGTPLKLEIWEDGGESVTKLNGDYKVQKNRCVANYTIKWDPDTLGKPLQLKGDSFQFYFRATIEKPPATNISNLLYVDLHRLVVSS